MLVSQLPSRTMDPRRYDFARSPMLVYWEMTQACMLACRHCRAEAMPSPHPLELDPDGEYGSVGTDRYVWRPVASPDTYRGRST
jgi:MoaA/NifB/PqqE/SkfB family radical SAM enzyme